MIKKLPIVSNWILGGESDPGIGNIEPSAVYQILTSQCCMFRMCFFLLSCHLTPCLAAGGSGKGAARRDTDVLERQTCVFTHLGNCLAKSHALTERITALNFDRCKYAIAISRDETGRFKSRYALARPAVYLADAWNVPWHIVQCHNIDVLVFILIFILYTFPSFCSFEHITAMFFRAR